MSQASLTTVSTRSARPVPEAAALRISGITRSIFRSGHWLSASTPGRPLSRLPARLSTGMSLASAKEATARRNACPRRSSSAGEGIGFFLMRGQEADHLTAHHQARHRQGQLDPVDAVDLQQLVPVQHVVDRDRIGSYQT